MLGVMRKLKYMFSRQVLNQMYVSYLEYWDGCSEQDKTALKRFQNEAARIVTGLTRSTSMANLKASTISTDDFSTLYTTLPHNLIRNQLVDLIENTFRREEALYLACNEERAFFASEEHKNMIYGLIKK